jgi:hypothetical protein
VPPVIVKKDGVDSESMNVPSVATGLKFSPDKDIKMFLSPDKVNSSIGTAVKNDDLPF